MQKSVCLRVYMTPERYMEIINEAKTYKIGHRSDSELIIKLVGKFLNELPLLVLERDRMKEALAQKNELIMQLENKIEVMKTKKVKK